MTNANSRVAEQYQPGAYVRTSSQSATFGPTDAPTKCRRALRLSTACCCSRNTRDCVTNRNYHRLGPDCVAFSWATIRLAARFPRCISHRGPITITSRPGTTSVKLPVPVLHRDLDQKPGESAQGRGVAPAVLTALDRQGPVRHIELFSPEHRSMHKPWPANQFRCPRRHLEQRWRGAVVTQQEGQAPRDPASASLVFHASYSWPTSSSFQHGLSCPRGPSSHMCILAILSGDIISHVRLPRTHVPAHPAMADHGHQRDGVAGF